MSGGRVHVSPPFRAELRPGLTLLHVEDHRLPAVVATLQIPGGGRLDPRDRPGLASLTASLLGKGSRNLGADALAERLDDHGFSWSARGGWDSFSVTLAGLSEDVEPLLELLGEIAVLPTFPGEEVAVMKRRRLSALARSMDDPSTLADWAFAMHLFEDHPYGHPLAGTPAAVREISATEMRELHRRSLGSGGAWLAMAGAVDAATLPARCAGLVAAWPGPVTAAGSPDPVPEAPAGPRVILVDRPDLTQAQIRWGHPGIRRDDPDHDACEVMNWALGGGGFSSRMIQRIRAEKGLTYGVSSTFDARRLGGAFRVSTFTPNDSVAEVVDEIDALVREYRDSGPTEGEVSAACDRFVGGYALRFETPSQVAARFLEAEFYGLPVDGINTYQDRVRALEREQLAALAARRLRPENALLVVVGRADVYAAALAARGQVERIDYRALLGS